MKDEELVIKLKAREEGTIDILYDKYFDRAYYYTKRILCEYGSKEDVEECVSDIFLALWKEIDKFDSQRGSFDTFVNVKTRTVALNLKRKLQRSAQRRVNGCIEELDLVENVSVSAEEQVFDKIGEYDILHAIDEFKEPDRTYFYLRYFMNYEIKAIVEAFNTTVSAVDNRLYRCRLLLRKNIGKEVV
ncbi:sigma-70 family RNA polymerase sigma factor [Clostridium estertheticum]|uniref:sigma-70 family RNA polymerase sigma factor n=1 Tax=Clostridium estertheticum TaxID=238834 RepID=UPI001C0C771E|nr:sigma-70 family RNA polymerase sigma factor [Clostridium estertheticum]MBU3175769.1 sigma-70 family RNA polymerase sigma factor [Clostridium estertheticum]